LADQSKRLPLQRQISETAVARGIDVLSAKGLGLPCTISTVNDQTVTVDIQVAGLVFQPLTVPIAEPLYSRAPFQVGDAGVILSVDAALGAVSGLTSAMPPLQATGNLGAAFFFPISSRKWAANPDGSMYLLQGPNGFLIRSLDGTVSISGDKRSALVMAYGGNAITINSSGINMTGAGTDAASINITSTGVNVIGTFFVNSHPYLAHEHSGVQTGAGNTSGVVAGT